MASITQTTDMICSPVHLHDFIASTYLPKGRNCSGMFSTSTEIGGDYLEKKISLLFYDH